MARFYFEDIQQSFVEMIKIHYGSNVIDIRSKIEIIDEAYYFIKFG